MSISAIENVARLGRDEEAATSFRQAAELTANIAEQHFLRDRANACVWAVETEALRPDDVDSV